MDVDEEDFYYHIGKRDRAEKFKGDFFEQEKAYRNAITLAEKELADLAMTRSATDTKALAMRDQRLNIRILYAELGRLYIKRAQEGLKDPGIPQPPIRGQIGWTFEGFASIENAKEYYIFHVLENH